MEPYSGDLHKTDLLAGLFEIPPIQRNESWKSEFLSNVADASFACGDPQVIVGPDGFLYFNLMIPEPYKEFQCYVIRHMKDDFLLHEGFGVIINSNKEKPDWVFSYGDIVNFHMNGEFYSKPDPEKPGVGMISNDNTVMAGQPSENFLPKQCRRVIKNYLKSLGMDEVGILLIHRPVPYGAYPELVFKLTAEKFINEAEYERVMKSLSWFLPRHYTYASAEDFGLAESYEDL